MVLLFHRFVLKFNFGRFDFLCLGLSLLLVRFMFICLWFVWVILYTDKLFELLSSCCVCVVLRYCCTQFKYCKWVLTLLDWITTCCFSFSQKTQNVLLDNILQILETEKFIWFHYFHRHVLLIVDLF